MLQRRDTIRLDDSASLGGRHLSPVTRAGIFVYHNEDGTMRRELRPPEWVFHPDSLVTLAQVPVTLGHPDDFVTDDNFSELAVGFTGDTVRRDGNFVMTPIKLSRRDAKMAVAGGIRELSCGYEFDRLDMTPGEYEGEQYDAVQVGPFKYNHVALVSQGRAGPDVRYLDGVLSSDHLAAAIAAGANMKSQTIAGVTLRVDDAKEMSIPADLASLLLKMHAKMEEMEGELEEAKAIRAGAEQIAADDDKKSDDDMKDGYDKKDDDKKDDDKKSDDDDDMMADDDMCGDDGKRKNDAASIQARVDARIALIRDVEAHLPAGYDFGGKGDHQVRCDALKALRPDVKLDGKSSEYVAAYLDAALAATRMDSYRGLNAPAKASVSTVDKAHNEYLATVQARQNRERGLPA